MLEEESDPTRSSKAKKREQTYRAFRRLKRVGLSRNNEGSEPETWQPQPPTKREGPTTPQLTTLIQWARRVHLQETATDIVTQANWAVYEAETQALRAANVAHQKAEHCGCFQCRQQYRQERTRARFFGLIKPKKDGHQ